MLNQGDVVVYRCKGTYLVKDISKLDFSSVDSHKEYYILQSIEDTKDIVYIPAKENPNVRTPLTRDEAMSLIYKIDNIETLWVDNERMREAEYKKRLSSFNPEEWIKILKTLYARTKKRGSMTNTDKKYQSIVEKALYSELSYALNISVDEVEKFICDNVEKIS